MAGAGICSIVLFLFANVKTIDSGVGYSYLVATVGCVICILATTVNPVQSIVFRRSAFFMLAFLTYFVFKLLLDLSDTDEIKAMSVGTDGGLIFGFLFGVVASILTITSPVRSRDSSYAIWTTFLFLILYALLAWDSCSTHLANIRIDLFVINDEVGLYQRPGNFLIMIAILASVQLAQVMRVKSRNRFALTAGLAGCLAAYLTTMAILEITSQLVGSNIGSVVIAIISLETLVWILRPKLTEMRWGSVLSGRWPNPVRALRRCSLKFAFVGTLLIIVAIGLVAGLLAYMELGIEQFRIVGYSERNFVYSMMSRVDIFERNFLTHFAYSPLFGTLNVEVLTTGAGSYAHSLVSMLSHLGIVGTVLFIAYLVALYRELKKPTATGLLFYGDLDLGMFRVMIGMTMLFCAAIGTFFTWMPMWFALGLLFSPVIIRAAGTAPIENSLGRSMAY